MRRAHLALGLLAGAVAGAACLTFNFARPSESADSGADAPSEAPTTSEAGAEGGTSFLSPSDAAKLCAQIFRCGRLAEAIELSLALPVNTPASPLNYSACMDWMAGPVDPKRPGLAVQQSILLAVASAVTCAGAQAQLPVEPVKADGGCTPGCASATSLTVCSPSGTTFTAACGSDWFGQTGDCFAPDSGLGGNLADGGSALCFSTGSCTSGQSCIDTDTLRDCYHSAPPGFTAWKCSISGRQCASASGNLAACVVPGKLAPPCLFKEVKDTCDGDSVVHCAGGFMPQTELDCAPFGESCSTQNAAGVARCVLPGDAGACTPFDSDQNQCQGSSVSVCIAGVRQTIDCTGTGLPGTPGTCVGADATHTGHCE
jgi:hypothetical protein